MNQYWAQTLQPKYTVVGEVKTCSPFGFKSKKDGIETLKWLDSWADIISIHTNPLWGGSFRWLEAARRITEKPILAKGFHNTQVEVDRAFNCGANYVLTVGWWNGDNRCWYEPNSAWDLSTTNAQHVVWNSRDPRTGNLRPDGVTLAGARALLGNRWLCQASHIKSPSDVSDEANAVLIGEALN